MNKRVHSFAPPLLPISCVTFVSTAQWLLAHGMLTNPAHACDSQFTPQAAHLCTDTVAGSLLLEVERLKERLQRQADIAVRAEAALTQMAVASKQTQEALRKQLAEARVVAVAATEGRDKIEHEHERLHQERADMVAKIATLEVELDDARHAVTEDRATLAATVRNATAKEEGLEET